MYSRACVVAETFFVVCFGLQIRCQWDDARKV